MTFSNFKLIQTFKSITPYQCWLNKNKINQILTKYDQDQFSNQEIQKKSKTNNKKKKNLDHLQIRMALNETFKNKTINWFPTKANWNLTQFLKRQNSICSSFKFVHTNIPKQQHAIKQLQLKHNIPFPNFPIQGHPSPFFCACDFFFRKVTFCNVEIGLLSKVKLNEINVRNDW